MAAYRLSYLYEPILAPLLANHPTTIAITAASLLHVGLVLLGLPGWPCPVRETLGIPCPGCGLSRAMIALFHGDWRTTLLLHAFAPLFIIALGLVMVVTILPNSAKNGLVYQVEVIERHTGITAILLICLVFYWLARLLILRGTFINLISG
jgi:hypothetical protein